MTEQKQQKRPPRLFRCKQIAYAVEHTQQGHAIAVLRCILRRSHSADHAWGVEVMRLADQQPQKRRHPNAKR